MMNPPFSFRFSRLAARPRAALAAAALLAASFASAQPAPHNGPRQVDPRWHAQVGGDVVARPGHVIENATIVIRDGVIRSVEANGSAPEGARVWDVSGLMIYAGLIEPHHPVAAPSPDSDKVDVHWNGKVTPQRSALDGAGMDEKTRASMREMGFAAAALAPEGGVFRGTSALVALTDDADLDSASTAYVLADPLYQEVAFESGGWGSREYPTSQMGAIALIRQTLLDADWRAGSQAVYASNPEAHEPPAPSAALEAMDAATPLLFNVGNELEALRAGKIAREFDRRLIVLGAGVEFRRLDALADDGADFIIPLRFPKTPDVDSRADFEATTLRELLTWEQAPTNPRRMKEAGLRVALTTDKLNKGDKFFDNLRKAIEHGLSEDDALAMLTTDAAAILGVDDRLGAVEAGMLANLVVTDGPMFEKKTTIRDVWVGGRRYEINPTPPTQFAGEWEFTFDADPSRSGVLTLTISDAGKPGVSLSTGADDDEALKARGVKLNENRLSYIVDMAGAGGPALGGAVIEGDEMLGVLTTAEGETWTWTARRADSEEGQPDEEGAASTDADGADDAPDVPASYGAPLGAYGLEEIPEQRDVIVTNGTVWTSGPEGVIENGEIEISSGKITYVGEARRFGRAADAEVIDAAGRHITPGLIDCHSHTGISGGVNEGTQAVTCEVRIADVIDPDDINWYRQLAGGLTAANQLHGSANPIGGQNSVVKLRWGAAHPDQMRIEGAAAGVKFALGENVKQTHWGEDFTTRYPKTRMGVEAIIRDGFVRGRDYARAHEAYANLSEEERRATMPPRRDLEIEALAEIVAGDRLIHCHSYRQDEILMLCRLADEFGFKIGTFQHVLEGYKVAEALKESAIGASSFSDWWAYKFEVYDAIPDNGAIMNEVGVNVSFNSDSGELARRMNTEAAKAVRYGNVDPAEALKFVTINPAIQLEVDDRIGSLEVGKDADFVIWSGDPLSTMARCESTWVDGREYFSLERDAEMRERARSERVRIAQKILKEGAPEPGDKDEEVTGADDEVAPEEDAEPGLTLIQRVQRDAVQQHYLDMLRAGLDPDTAQCGVCGCAGNISMVVR